MSMAFSPTGVKGFSHFQSAFKSMLHRVVFSLTIKIHEANVYAFRKYNSRQRSHFETSEIKW